MFFGEGGIFSIHSEFQPKSACFMVYNCWLRVCASIGFSAYFSTRKFLEETF